MTTDQEIFNQATKLHQSGKIEESQALYLKIIKNYKDNDKLNFLLGTSYLQSKKFNKAIEYLSVSIKINPKFPDSFNNRGIALAELYNYHDAIIDYDEALKLNPNFYSAILNKGIALKNIKEYQKAIESFEACINLNPNDPKIFNNLGNVFKDKFLNEKAIDCYKNAIRLNPKFADAHNNLGIASQALGRFEEAAASYTRALNLDKNIEYLAGNRFYNKQFICNWNDFDNDLNKILKSIKEKKNAVDPFILLGITDDPKYHKLNAEVFINSKFNSQNKKILNKNINKKRDKIKIGYFSAEFHRHPVLLLMMDVFKNHDKSSFEIFAFSHGPSKEKDPWRNLVKPYFNDFFDVKNKTTEEISKLCKKLELDIAINLTGLTANHRTDIFENRVAPIQINFLGYPGTMGAKFMDYIIADRHVIPEDLKKNYTENILYLPDCYQPNSKNLFTHIKQKKKVFKRSDFDLPENETVFCSFNSNYKITPLIFTSWMNILKKVNNSVLWIYAYNEPARKNLRLSAKKQNINPNRILFAEKMSILQDHLERMKLADIFLDTWPYNAHTSASDSIRVGLPIITLTGKSFVSRVGSSILNNIDMSELVTTNFEDYENLAIELATNKLKLQSIKDKLKQNFENSPLFDSLKFTKNLEKLYKEITVNKK